MPTPSPLLRVAMTVEQAWQPVPGGSGVYVAELTRHLAGRVDLVGVSALHRRPAPEDWAPHGRVRAVPLPRPVLYESWQRLGLPLVEWSVGRVDVVHASTWALPATRRPLVVTVHDVAFLADPGHFTARGNEFFRRALDAVRTRAAAIIVPSEQTRDDCVDVGLDPGLLHVVPHGNRLARATPAEVDHLRARHGLDRPYLLWTGTLEPRKNVRAVLDAFARVRRERPDLELVLVGPQGWGDVAAPAEGSGVRTLGSLPTRELAAAYAGAEAFCFPSFREGFGLPVLEAMAAGVPVVTSAGTACAEVAGDAGLLVDPHDHEALGAALLDALARAPELRARSLARAAEFSWHAAAERTVDVYARAAGRA